MACRLVLPMFGFSPTLENWRVNSFCNICWSDSRVHVWQLFPNGRSRACADLFNNSFCAKFRIILHLRVSFPDSTNDVLDDHIWWRPLAVFFLQTADFSFFSKFRTLVCAFLARISHYRRNCCLKSSKITNFKFSTTCSLKWFFDSMSRPCSILNANFWTRLRPSSSYQLRFESRCDTKWTKTWGILHMSHFTINRIWIRLCGENVRRWSESLIFIIM